MEPDVKLLLCLSIAGLGCLLGLKETHGPPSDQLTRVSTDFPIEVALHGHDSILLVGMLEDPRCILFRSEYPILQDSCRTDHFVMTVDDHGYLLGGVQLRVFRRQVLLLQRVDL